MITVTNTARTVPGFRPVPGDTRVPYCPAGTEYQNAAAIANASLRAQMQLTIEASKAARNAAHEIYKVAQKEESDLFAISLQAIGTPDGPAVKALWEASLERRTSTLKRWLELT